MDAIRSLSLLSLVRLLAPILSHLRLIASMFIEVVFAIKLVTFDGAGLHQISLETIYLILMGLSFDR